MLAIMAHGAARARSLMIATQRFDRDGLIISALCHVAILVAVVLLFARAAPQKIRAARDRASGCYAGRVRYAEGHPALFRYAVHIADLRHPTSGRIAGLDREKRAATNGSIAATTKRPISIATQRAAETARVADRPAADEGATAPACQRGESSNGAAGVRSTTAFRRGDTRSSDAAAKAAFLALAGGRLGGGFSAPPVNSPLVGYDFTLAVPRAALFVRCAAVRHQSERKDQHYGAGFPQSRRHGRAGAGASRCKSFNGTTDADAKLRQRPAEMPALHHAAAGPIQPVETLDLVVHPHNYVAQ